MSNQIALFPMKLREWRLAQNLTLKQAAAVFGISISKLSDIERGLAIISRELMARIDGVTAGAVAADDHYLTWRQSCPEEFAALRKAGREAWRAFQKGQQS
jgi:transcriptional regulator with XRE-family HTH domain